MKLTSLLCPLTLLMAVGCASTGPTPELIDARRAYDEARSSDAAAYSPDKLLSAKQALERAESVHADDPGSFEERSTAYVAQRRAQYAALYGKYEKDRREQAETEQAYRQKQDTLRKNAERQANDAQKSLATTWDNLTSARREIAAQQSQIQKSQAELDAEKQARAKAEQSAAAAMASLSKIAQVKEEQRGVVITLDGAVLFVTGKSELLPIARDKLNEVAKALKDMDDSKLASIEGFTDSRGADDMNLKLSQDRANMVMSYLVSQGVRADKLRAVGRGEANPVASNDTPEGRANNRRVEIIIQTAAQAVEGMKR
jgi:outer membrane protein OmpA-like peptidoglycan-associated protein